MTRFKTAMVLTAGLGTRLRPLTDVRAKPAVPVGGESILRRILRWLASGGVSDVVLNLHHLPQTIAADVGDGSEMSVHVRYSWEQPVVLGGAGGPRHALSLLGAGTFLLINGDTLTDMDLTPLADAHDRSGAQVTMALVPNREPSRYGGVRLDAQGAVTGFSARGNAEGSYHFIGVQAVCASVFAPLAEGRPADSIGGLYDQLIEREPGAVRGLVCGASFRDVGTLADYWSTSWALIDASPDRACWRGHGGRIDPSARVVRSILWDDVEVAGGVVLDECLVTDGVHVPPGSTFRRSVLLRGSGNGPIMQALGI